MADRFDHTGCEFLAAQLVKFSCLNGFALQFKSNTVKATQCKL